VTRYVVEGIFLLETKAENSQDAQYKAREVLKKENVKLYIVNAWEKKEAEFEDEF